MKMVVKIAGALLDDPEAVRSLARQIAQLVQQGHELLVVHGGGKLFTATLKRMGVESRFVNGLRVTDRQTRDVAVMVLGGLLRSEEHTSELQSRSDLVCRLLLEKKNN